MRRVLPRQPLAFLCAGLIISTLVGARAAPITRLSYDADAPVVELFEGIDQGLFEVRVVMNDEYRGRVFVHNTSDQPQTEEVPKAVVGIHVLKQIGGPFSTGQAGPLNQPFGQNNTAYGPAQAAAGQLSPSGSQSPTFNSFNGPGPSFFTIPPEKTVQLQMSSVCIDHGKPAPIPRMSYLLRRLDQHTANRALVKLIENADRQKTDRLALQAAAWHLANRMSWDDLTRKTVTVGAGVQRRLFAPAHLEAARALVDAAHAAVASVDKSQIADRAKE